MLNNTMNMYDDWHPFSCYCPNCGQLVTMYGNSESLVKTKCPTCNAVMVCRQKGRRHYDIGLFAP